MSDIKITAVSPKLKAGNVSYNAEEIVKIAKEEAGKGTNILLFPELAVSGCSCGDLFSQRLLRTACQEALKEMALELPSEMLTVVGAAVENKGNLYNCAVSFLGGNMILATPKTEIKGDSDIDEKRHFSNTDLREMQEIAIGSEVVPVGDNIVLTPGGNQIRVGIVIDSSRINPTADVVLDLAASQEIIGSNEKRKTHICRTSKDNACVYVYASAGALESTAAGVFSGDCTIAFGGRVLSESERMQLDTVRASAEINPTYILETLKSLGKRNKEKARAGEEEKEDKKDFKSGETYNSPHPFIPENEYILKDHCAIARDILTTALARRLMHLGCKDVVIGVSGGLDSTLALLVSCNSFDKLGLSRKGIHAYTMPGLGTTDVTKTIADDLMNALDVSKGTIDISDAVKKHFEDIGHDLSDYNVTYENAQARERTQILMDISNEVGGMVVGTGDMSESAIGWCTYNGDQMSMYGLNSNIPKTFIPPLIMSFREIFGDEVGDITKRVTDIPISPELLPAGAEGEILQKTEDIVGSYALHDYFLYHMIGYAETPEEIFKAAKQAFAGTCDEDAIKKQLITFIKRFFSAQFKRTASPEGPKVGSVCISAHGGWEMPADADPKLWIKAAEDLAGLAQKNTSHDKEETL